MTIYLQCDYCGEPIDDDDEHVTISALGREDTPDRLGWHAVNERLGPYHATLERPCYEEMWQRMCLVHEHAKALENIQPRALKRS